MKPSDTNITTWQSIRRYAVPEKMIEECTAHRLAGDWRAACEAANIEVTFDSAPEPIEADLIELAPDLLRWHLPRAMGGRTSLATHGAWVLSSAPGRIEPGTTVLRLRLPLTVDGSQRLRLELAELPEPGQLNDLAPWFWSAAHVGQLRTAYGGSANRLPRFAPDGAPLPPESFAVKPDPADPASYDEVASMLISQGELVRAWATAGITLDATVPEGAPEYARVHPNILLRQPLQLTALAAEARRLSGRYGLSRVILGSGRRALTEIRVSDSGELTAVIVKNAYEHYKQAKLSLTATQRPADLELLWQGLITGAELHPLVRQALAPVGRGVSRDEQPLPERVLVRCRGEWHGVENRAFQVIIPEHTDEELRREEALRSLGGQVTGCFGARLAWSTGLGRLPKGLRAHRRNLFQRLLHGDAGVVLSLLDEGLDPLLRDARGQTLLHHLRRYDHTVLLPRLLEAGVPVNAKDRKGRTPLHVAVGDGGSAELVHALLAAGADPSLMDGDGTTVVELGKYKSNSWGEDDDEDDEEDTRRPHLVEIYRALREWAAK
jgi:hypothetical protein